MKRYFLFSVALMALSVFVGTLSHYLTHDSAANSVIVTAIVSLLVASVCLGIQVKEDPDAVMTFTSVFLLLVTICEVVYLFSARHPGWVPKIMASVSGIGAVGLGFITYRRQFGPGSADFPNVLRAEFDPAGVFEMDGVQFTGVVEPGAGDQPHWVSVLVQNCFDAARTVSVKFDAEGHSKYLRHHTEYTAHLGPAEVRRLRFAVISPTYPGEYHLFFKVGATGSGGKRVRLWRSKTPETRITGGASLALLAVGMLSYGGGLRFKIGPLESDLWAASLPEPVDELVWQPKYGTVDPS